MSALALVAREWGAEVGGSDRARSSYVERLEETGMMVAIGHDAANVREGGGVIVSSAIAPDNPELGVTRGGGSSWGRCAALLAAVGSRRLWFVGAGAHGKTAAAGVFAFVLGRRGRGPGWL